jgi:hypothetical protein
MRCIRMGLCTRTGAFQCAPESRIAATITSSAASRWLVMALRSSSACIGVERWIA